MHYVDEGAGEVILCLHGEPSWSYLYRKFIPVLSKGHRIIAPDFIGFGKSDKYDKMSDYSFRLHFDTLVAFIEKLSLKDINLVVQDWGGFIGLSVLGAYPELFKRVVIMNTYLPIGDRPMPLAFKVWRTFARLHPNLPIGFIMKMGSYKRESKKQSVLDAYKAPFPSGKYKAGTKAFPMLVPMKSDDPGVVEMKKARDVLSKWNKPALVMFSDKDPIMGGAVHFFRKLIPTTSDQPKITIRNAGHFLQEDSGEEIATHIEAFIKGELTAS